ncbi:MAG: hypothetical protein MJZ50_08680 [Treponema sp.]|nr:hypothetical protein [Treponema sp.]
MPSDIILPSQDQTKLGDLQAEDFAPSKDIEVIPVGDFTDLIYKGLNAGKDLPSLPDKETSDTEHSLSVVKKDESMVLSSETKYGKMNISFDNFAVSFKKRNSATKKVFVRAMKKLGEKRLTNDLFSDIRVEITTEELVALDMYSTLDSARVALKTATNLNDIKISGTVDYIEEGKRKSGEIVKDKLDLTGIQIFKTGIVRGSGTLVIQFDRNINYEYLLPNISILPNYYYSLTESGADLLMYLYGLAVNKAEEIAREGCFYVSLKDIHSYLNLPDYTKANNPKRDIKEKITDLIIGDIHEKDGGKNVRLSIVDVTENDTIAHWVVNGRLKVEMLGDSYKYFQQIGQKLLDNKKKK